MPCAELAEGLKKEGRGICDAAALVAGVIEMEYNKHEMALAGC